MNQRPPGYEPDELPTALPCVVLLGYIIIDFKNCQVKIKKQNKKILAQHKQDLYNFCMELELFPLFDMEAIKSGARKNRLSTSVKLQTLQGENQNSEEELKANSLHVRMTYKNLDFSEKDIDIQVPQNITFGFWKGDINDPILQDAIKSVDTEWVQFFTEKIKDRIYCAFDGDKIASFCIVDSFGNYKDFKVGGPGCVGTVPEYRKKGIGLKLVQKATEILKTEGYDLSFIHWTKVAGWYQKLGYKLILNWNCKGFNNL